MADWTAALLPLLLGTSDVRGAAPGMKNGFVWQGRPLPSIAEYDRRELGCFWQLEAGKAEAVTIAAGVRLLPNIFKLRHPGRGNPFRQIRRDPIELEIQLLSVRHKNIQVPSFSRGTLHQIPNPETVTWWHRTRKAIISSRLS
jgi:hypothetical protein